MRAPVLLLILAGACSPAVQSATYGPAGIPGRVVASDTPVRIYDQARPACAFEEIGWVSGSPRARGNSPDDVLNAMRARARQMGGDAIVGLTSSERTDTAIVAAEAPVPTVVLSSSNIFRGTVVRFTDPQCAG